MKRTTRLLILGASVVGAAGLATAGWAYWTTSGSGSASASVGTLNPPVIGTTTQQGLGTLRVNWTPSTGDVTPTGYFVQRYAGTTLDGYACGSSPALDDLKPGPACDDQGLTAAGPYNYKVTAVFRSWTAQSGPSNAVSVILDNTPPTVVSINRTAPQRTKAASVSWTVIFSEEIDGVNQADFELVGTAELGASITGITGVFGDATTYTVEANTGTGDGILGLNLIDDDTILDAADNPLGGWGTGNGHFTGQTYTIDKTAPTTTDNASSTWTTTAQTVTLTATDTGGSGLATTYYTTNGSTPTTSSAQGTSITLSAEGVYTIKYFSVDYAGNAEAVKTANQVRIDTTAPATTDNVSGAWTNTAQTVTLSATDGGAGVSTTYYTTDGSTPTTSSSQGTSIPLSAEGVYTIRYFSVDHAGNAEAVKTAANQVRIDKTAPTTSDNTGAIGTAWKNTTQTLTLSAGDSSGSGVAATYYTTDGTTPTTSSAQGNSVVLSTDGVYTIKYFSVDNAGNTEGVKTAGTQIRIDKTAPTTTDNAPTSWTNAASVSVTLSPSDGPGAGIGHTYYTTDGSDPTTSDSRTDGTTVDVTAAGTTTIRYYSIDNAGNSETPVKTATVRIDRTAPPTPVITFPGTGSYTNGPGNNPGTWNRASADANACGSGSQGMCGTATDAGSGVAAVQIALKGPNNTWWNGTITGGKANFTLASETFQDVSFSNGDWFIPWTGPTFGSTGNYSLTVKVTDTAGNSTTTSSTPQTFRIT